MADAHKESGAGSGRTSGGWLRRYPPLITFVAALVIMFLIMPSALNLPQANPTTVLEYAPVPPEEDDPPPPPQQGSLSDLSQGTSNTVTTEVGEEQRPDVPEAADDDAGEGENPRTLPCVDPPDGPPRQTEDPNSPPCVPFFEGDNGGETYQGVTGEEITVLVYASGGIIRIPDGPDDEGAETTPPTGTYCDVDKKPNSQEECLNDEGTQDHTIVQAARALSRYFNSRFQTYKRHVHFYIYWTGAGTPSGRRSDAQDNWETLKPYSVLVTDLFRGNTQSYVDAMAKRRVTAYTAQSFIRNEEFRENAPFMWGFWPDVEHSAELFTEYVCKRVAPFPVGNSGEPEHMGEERKYALLSTSDSSYPGIQSFADMVTDNLKQGCPNGAQLDIADEYTYPNNGFAIDSDPNQASTARTNMADMQSKDVTTIIWLGGFETEHSKAADQLGYYPEWVVAGDLENDQYDEGRHQNQAAWQYAWTMSHQLLEQRQSDTPCRQAFRQASPNGTESDENQACSFYRAFFMLFRGIQVAGPFLTPQAVDEGNHAIPAQESTSPFVAACFFDPGDYTCVKDAQESHWDPDAPDPNGQPNESGCYRMANGGVRHIAGKWEQADATSQFEPDDVCNAAGDGEASIN